MDVDWDKLEKDITAFDIDIYPLEDCITEYRIGNGKAMEVFKGQCKINTVLRDVAFKHHRELQKHKLKQRDVNRVLEDFRHEIKLMKRLKHHTNVIQIYGVTFEKRKPVLIVELCHETVDRYLLEKAESPTPATWDEKIKLCNDISRGLRSLHDASIIHGDIKGENILVFIEPTDIVTAKISDFGYSSSLSSKGNVGGTPIFMSPEARGAENLKQYVKKQTQDIFSFGLVTYQIANDGKRPYIDDDENLEDAEDINEISKACPSNSHTKSLLSKLPPNIPDQFRTIIIRTTKYMPPERASLEDIEQIIYEYWNPPLSQQDTTSYREARAVFESFALGKPIMIFDINELPISPSLKSNIFNEYRQLTGTGDAHVSFMLGSCWYYGFGVENDYLKAAECFTKAAEAGNAPAQNSLGFCYDAGSGVTKDIFKAVELYKKAAEAGNAKAQCNLGVCYEIGNGVTRDISEAVKLYQKAAEAGDPLAQDNLGGCYEEGLGVTKNINKAIELFTKAAKTGYPLAQKNLLRLNEVKQ